MHAACMLCIMQARGFACSAAAPDMGMCCLQARQAGGQERKARLQQALEAGQRIIIDLGFDDMMTEPQVLPFPHRSCNTGMRPACAHHAGCCFRALCQGCLELSFRCACRCAASAISCCTPMRPTGAPQTLPTSSSPACRCLLVSRHTCHAARNMAFSAAVACL